VSPGRLRVASCEVGVTDHCTLRCAHCNHSAPHLPPRAIVPERLADDLAVLREAMHSDEIRVTGGEPLLHERLEAVLDVIRGSGVAETVTLITNGTLPERLTPGVLERIDRLWIDVYPGVPHHWDWASLRRLSARHGVAVWRRNVRNFRLTILNSPIQDRSLVQTVYTTCRSAHAWSCIQIHEGAVFKCAVAPYLAPRLRRLGLVERQERDRGVTIRGTNTLARDLAEYLASPTPLPECRFCLGTIGRLVTHRQLDDEGRARELHDRQPSPERLISAGALLAQPFLALIGRWRATHRLKWRLRYGLLQRPAPR